MWWVACSRNLLGLLYCCKCYSSGFKGSLARFCFCARGYWVVCLQCYSGSACSGAAGGRVTVVILNTRRVLRGHLRFLSVRTCGRKNYKAQLLKFIFKRNVESRFLASVACLADVHLFMQIFQKCVSRPLVFDHG